MRMELANSKIDMVAICPRHKKQTLQKRVKTLKQMKNMETTLFRNPKTWQTRRKECPRICCKENFKIQKNKKTNQNIIG